MTEHILSLPLILEVMKLEHVCPLHIDLLLANGIHSGFNVKQQFCPLHDFFLSVGFTLLEFSIFEHFPLREFFLFFFFPPSPPPPITFLMVHP